MTLERPVSITDAFLDRLVARVPSTSGGTWKLTEVYTGEVLVELPQSTPDDVERAYASRTGWRCSSARTRCSSTTRRRPPT
ncbi:hypothetical protein [uncultured Nocardioides sp.]|uniref:hypothetical protein n=1 Tax=uncultured Nocardioides sp. TaxID=198441 RepID=UPI0026025F12|nr:hypothetical protein [uncultured Nocardioides sp.]